jgi:Mg2+-importing ATPase
MSANTNPTQVPITGLSAQEAPYWSRDVAELSAALGSGPGGLSSENATERLRQVGPNSVEEASHLSALRLLLRQFESPLVLILIIGAVISLALGNRLDATIILAIVLGSSLLGFYEEYRASAAVEELKRRLELTCRVVRNGMEQTVPANTIVPGDVIVLSAGNLIPADGLLLEATDFLVNEASLTGESFPVEKQPGIVPPETPLAGRTNAVYLGASAQSGKGKMLVVETGRRTAFGAISARLKARPPETDFERGIRQFGYMLLRVMMVIVLFVLTVNLLLGRPKIDSLLFAVALAVGLSPELLPAIISVTLSAGARAMAKQGVIVRRLDSIENLGSMDIFCTDKTGTLTEGVIVLQDATDPDGRTSTEIRQLAFLNAAFETGIDNPLDAALLAVGKSAGLTTSGYRKIDEIPYDFQTKRLTIVLAVDGDAAQHLIVTKGAFENVLALCSSVDRNGVNVPLTADLRARLEAFYQAKGEAGFRVLAVATRKISAKDRYAHNDEGGLVFAGFLVFFDPPKKDAQKTLSDLANLGIHVKVISGDNRHVTAHLAEAVGLDPKSILASDQLAKLNDEALGQVAPRTDLFVEVDPQQKERIVRALQRTGHAVGYLGDGINDAPALHAADVGISVDQAVDVARESADIILLKPDLDVLRHGVEDGRRTFANTLKYINITNSASFGNMISMALGTPLLPFLPMTAKQILLENFLSDLPSMTISTDNVDAETVKSPERWQIKDVKRFMIVFGLISSLFDLLTFAILLHVFHSGAAVFQTTWFVISLLTEVAVVLVLRTRGPALRSKPSRLLLRTSIVMAVFALAIPYLGPFASAFGFVPLSALQMVTVLVITAGYIAATEGAKAWFYKTGNKSQPVAVA